eukprot:10223-Lingulodinium_polyedra.AAC.1
MQLASAPGPVRLPSVPWGMNTRSPSGMSLVTTRLRLTFLQEGHWCVSHFALASHPSATAGGGD